MNSQFKRIFIPILIITGFLSLLHFFIFQISTDDLSSTAKTTVGIILILGTLNMPTGVLLSYTAYRKNFKALTWLSYIWLGFFNLLFHFSIVELLVQWVYPHGYSYWVLIGASIIAIWALYKGLKFPKISRHQLPAPDFLVGKTLVQISDLHVGMLHLNENWLARIVEKINSLQADFVAITGDLVEGSFETISPQLKPLNDVKAKNSKFYVTGNHEYIHQSTAWEGRLQELGFISLHNSAKIISIVAGPVTSNATGNVSGKLQIAGVPDRMVKRFTGHLVSDPEKALRTTEKVDYRILLAHEPTSVFDLKSEKCDVILTGHTHGGQIFPFSLYVRLIQPMVKGFKTINSTLVFAHQGTGFWGPPMRWFTDSEIVVFEFIKKN